MPISLVQSTEASGSPKKNLNLKILVVHTTGGLLFNLKNHEDETVS